MSGGIAVPGISQRDAAEVPPRPERTRLRQTAEPVREAPQSAHKPCGTSFRWSTSGG